MDPYRVLGVSPDASDDEVKKAYRSLSRKYHPDANVNNPNKERAEEMFKQVQQAYQIIMKQRQQGTGYQGFGSSYSNRSTYSYRYSQSDAGTGSFPPEMQAAINYINTRHYREAMNALLAVSENSRGGSWYYLAAIASEGMGNLVNAKNFIARAVSLEPSNFQYRQFQQHLESGGMWYSTQGAAYEQPYEGQSWCMDMVLMNLFCNFCFCI